MTLSRECCLFDYWVSLTDDWLKVAQQTVTDWVGASMQIDDGP